MYATHRPDLAAMLPSTPSPHLQSVRIGRRFHIALCCPRPSATCLRRLRAASEPNVRTYGGDKYHQQNQCSLLLSPTLPVLSSQTTINPTTALRHRRFCSTSAVQRPRVFRSRPRFVLHCSLFGPMDRQRRVDGLMPSAFAEPDK